MILCLRAHVLQHYDGLKAPRMSSRPAPSDGRQRGYMSMLDELTLEHMTQDCSSLKNQLLRLKTLLQVRPTFVKKMLACAKTCTHLQYTHTHICTYSIIGQQHIHMLGMYMHKHVCVCVCSVCTAQ